MPICPAEGCRQSIIEGQNTLKISPGSLQRGKKSGTLYHSATLEEEILIHYGCALLFFNPQADKDMYDHFYQMVHDQIRDEELEDIKQQAYSEAAEDVAKLCPECLTTKEDDPDAPPEEYECECGSHALPICPDCGNVSDAAIDTINNQAA